MNKKTFKILISLVVILTLLYLVIWFYTQRDLLNNNYNPNKMLVYFKIIGRRALSALAILISTILIASSSLVFQTVTKNRILTPSVLGFDSIFIVTQTLLVAFLGIASTYISNVYVNFFISVFAMVFITLLLYKFVLRKNKNNVILLLLVGMIISSLAGSISNFIQVYMNPEEFQSVQGLTTVSLTNINQKLIWVSLPIMIVLTILFYRKNNVYDVLALGDSQAITLGVEYQKEVRLSLIYIAIAVSISTALIGPLMFLGLIAVNTAREIFKTNKHKVLLLASSLISYVILMFGQIIVELLGNKTSVSVLISLIGGSYMIYLIIRENKI